MARSIANPLSSVTQVKVMRRRVLQHDLDMYSAIAGKPAEVAPQEAPVEQAVRVKTAARAKPWSAAVLANYLENLTVPRLASRVVRPEVADWMRKMSSHAIGRIQEAQDRLAAARETSEIKRRKAG